MITTPLVFALLYNIKSLLCLEFSQHLYCETPCFLGFLLVTAGPFLNIVGETCTMYINSYCSVPTIIT